MTEPTPTGPIPHASLAEALAAVQAVLPRVGKDNTAKIPAKDGKSGYSYSYADLADVTQAILPLMGQHGLSWSCLPTVDPELTAFGLRYRLRHVSGEEDGGFYPLSDPRNTAPQVLGSAITYARRYLLQCVTGITPDGDDDGAAAQAAHDPRREQPAEDKPVPEEERPAAAAAIVESAMKLSSPAAVIALRKSAGMRGLLTTLVEVPGRDERMPLDDVLAGWKRTLEARREGGQQARQQPRQGSGDDGGSSAHSQPPAGA